MSYENNPYYNPQDWGFTVVHEHDEGESFEFDIKILWVDSEGRFWYAEDSGCSCPTPFEDVDSYDDLIRITNRDQLISLGVHPEMLVSAKEAGLS
jgi:hypothetical protein